MQQVEYECFDSNTKSQRNKILNRTVFDIKFNTIEY